MDFYAVLGSWSRLLQRRGRVTYRALKRQFQLDDEHLEDLKAELIEAHRWPWMKQGKVLVWTLGAPPSSPAAPLPAPGRAPLAYTPPHLAEKVFTPTPASASRSRCCLPTSKAPPS